MAAKKIIDQVARDRALDDFGTCFCLEAGAGTGKTTLLVGRITSLLEKGLAGVDEIAAITFTEKAAAEMKMRLRDAMEERIAWGDAASDRFREALEKLESASISTIHAFAAGLLRARPVEAGVDPGFEMLEPAEEAAMIDESLDRWLLENSDAGRDALRYAAELGFDLERIRDLAPSLVANFDVRDFAGVDITEGIDISKLERIRDEIESVLELCSNASDKAAGNCRETVVLIDAALAADAAEILSALDDLHSCVNLRLGGVKSNWSSEEAKDRQKELRKEVRAEAENLKSALRSRALLGVLRWLSGFVRSFREEKRRAGLMSFDDLLLYARNLLRDAPVVRDYFRRKYKYILVDEFQDTDLLQAEIAFHLASTGSAPDWRDLRLTPGKLFVVGDPKQSIYRFRSADVETYEFVKDRIASMDGGEKLDILQNFRTVPGVVEWVNRGFERVIYPPDDGRYQPEYARLEAHRSACACPSVAVLRPAREYYDKDAAKEAEIKTDDVRAEEASYVARFIGLVVDNQDFTFVPKGESEARRFTYADFAVLFPRLTEWETYERAFMAAGIPARLEGGRDFYRKAEIKSLESVLRAVLRSHDALSVLAALRSEFFAVSDADLACHSQGGGTFDYERSRSSGVARIDRAFEILRDLARLKRELSARALMRELFRRTAALQSFAVKPHGLQAAANLMKILDQAGKWESEGRGGLADFVERLAHFDRVSVDERDSPLVEEGGDFVRVMTIHKSKGLEFPAVIAAMLFGREGGGGGSVKTVVDRRDSRLEIRAGSKDDGFETPGYAEAEELEKTRERAEKVRTLYVSATRARDLLVVPFFGWEGTHAETLREMFPGLEDFSDPEPCYSVFSSENLPEVDVSGFSADALPSLEENAAARQILAERERWAESVKATVKAGSRPPDLAVAPSAEKPHAELLELGLAPTSGARGVAFGSAFHAVMEAVLGPRRLDPDDAVEGFTGEKWLDELAEMARRTSDHPLVARAAAAKKLYLEMPFTVRAADGLRAGYMDLVFEEEGEYVVVDYKTDSVPEDATDETLLARHRTQGEAYAAALASLGVRVREVYFLFTRPSRAVSFTP